MEAAAAIGGDDAPVVLVVDDHDDTRWSVAELLRAAGFRVLEAADAAAALRLAASDPPPALALVDVGLPGRSGIELRRELAVPALLVSGYPRRHLLAHGLLPGDLLLQKPVYPRDLLAIVCAAAQPVRDRTLSAGVLPPDRSPVLPPPVVFFTPRATSGSNWGNFRTGD